MKRGWEYFARSVAAPDDLPEAVRDALLGRVPAVSISLLVVIPPQQFPSFRHRWLQSFLVDWRWTPHRTLAFSDDAILLVEGVQAGVLDVAVIPLRTLLEIRLTSVLLYTCLDLVWKAGAAVEQRQLEFNAVGRTTIERGLAQARTALASQVPYAPLHDDAALPFRDHLPLKFANMTRLSLLPGERVQWAQHAPPLRRGGARRWQYHAPGRAFVLTPQHLIAIEEGVPQLFDSYRLVQRFVPRGQVRCVRREAAADAAVVVVECGAGPAPYTLRFAMTRSQANELVAALEPWIAAPLRLPLNPPRALDTTAAEAARP